MNFQESIEYYLNSRNNLCFKIQELFHQLKLVRLKSNLNSDLSELEREVDLFKSSRENLNAIGVSSLIEQASRIYCKDFNDTINILNKFLEKIIDIEIDLFDESRTVKLNVEEKNILFNDVIIAKNHYEMDSYFIESKIDSIESLLINLNDYLNEINDYDDEENYESDDYNEEDYESDEEYNKKQNFFSRVLKFLKNFFLKLTKF
jgi:hypothetical protein